MLTSGKWEGIMELYENMENIAVRMIPECIGVWYGCSFYSWERSNMEKFQTSDIPGILLWMAGGWTGYWYDSTNMDSEEIAPNLYD